MLNLKSQFIGEKKKHAISEMSWRNVLRRAGSDYCVNKFSRHFRRFSFEEIYSRNNQFL